MIIKIIKLSTKNRFKKIVLLLIISSFQFLQAQITLTHNVGNTPIETDMFSCERDETWSRVFKLTDFGIASNEQFSIKSGQVALSKSDNGAYLQISVYSIDDDFPNFFQSSFPRTLLGTRGMGLSPIINGAPEIIETYFDKPIVVPAGVDRILVSIHKSEDFYNPSSAQVFIAGTLEDTGNSWYLGCGENYKLTPTTELNTPVPNANFYINVTGEVFNAKSLGTTTRLSHNVCDDLIETSIHSCTSAYIYWARAFTLKDFGISTNEEFIINSGQVGINKTGYMPEISFNIYKIDDNFPSSFSETDLIGSSQYQTLSPNIRRNSQIIQVDFDTPIVIPAGVERILVEVHKGIIYGDGLAFIGGSAQDNDISWQRGCTNVAGGATYNADQYVSTVDFGRPDANFYINVTGNVNHVTNNFDMNISNICSDFLKEFSLENTTNIASVIWDFGDVASGINNTSLDLSPFHDFSADGNYTITATITDISGNIEVLTENINVKEPPNAYGISNIYACEDIFNTGISSTFILSDVEKQVLGGQTNKKVTFIDGSGREYNTFPYSFTNSIRDRETITVRVAHIDNLCCYSETTFDLIVNPLQDLKNVSDLIICDDDTDGFAFFNLDVLKSTVIGGLTNLDVQFFRENGQQIIEPLNAVQNIIPNIEVIAINVINRDTNCSSYKTFKLMINTLPTVNMLNELVGCDDNNDGISEFFDTSNVEQEVLGSQINMLISYFDESGNLLPSPLPNPYTNTNANKEIITVRLTDPLTMCYTETQLVLSTSSKPQINKPQTIYGCDIGNGFANFDTSNIESELIGNQNGLKVIYFDINGYELLNPISASFRNTQAWNQTINIRVENKLNSSCFTETSFDLVVNKLPKVIVDETYYLCNLEPFLSINVENGFDTYKWVYQDNTIISNRFEADLINAGNYTLIVGENKNGIYCENSFEFKLIRSVLPKIIKVNLKDLSDNNFIEIIASGDGDFEYSIDGTNYQNSNFFNNILGGIYNVTVRDINGCGEDSQEVTIIDYPKFFSPNFDGINDTWQISGIKNFPDSKIYIYDRYGKLLKQINSDSKGWDGNFQGENMISSDYWFKADLGNGTVFSGHFALKR